MENTCLILSHTLLTFRKLDFLTQTLSTLDIQLVIVSNSDSARRETRQIRRVFVHYLLVGLKTIDFLLHVREHFTPTCSALFIFSDDVIYRVNNFDSFEWF
jgi:hypothetical protein